jgi:hypothetical protein
MTPSSPEHPHLTRESFDGRGAADHDTPYAFGRLPRALAPFPFSTRELARLMVLRSRVQGGLFGADDHICSARSAFGRGPRGARSAREAPRRVANDYRVWIDRSSPCSRTSRRGYATVRSRSAPSPSCGAPFSIHRRRQSALDGARKGCDQVERDQRGCCRARLRDRQHRLQRAQHRPSRGVAVGSRSGGGKPVVVTRAHASWRVGQQYRVDVTWCSPLYTLPLPAG